MSEIESPQAINVRMQSRLLEIVFADVTYNLPFELLRVYSPSAEVRGHGEGQEVLQTGKREVSVTALLPVGHYAVQPHFNDGHNTGIFSWTYLRWLGANQADLWQDYLQKLQQAGFPGETGRDAPMVHPAADGDHCKSSH